MLLNFEQIQFNRHKTPRHGQQYVIVVILKRELKQVTYSVTACTVITDGCQNVTDCIIALQFQWPNCSSKIDCEPVFFVKLLAAQVNTLTRKIHTAMIYEPIAWLLRCAIFKTKRLRTLEGKMKDENNVQ